MERLAKVEQAGRAVRGPFESKAPGDCRPELKLLFQALKAWLRGRTIILKPEGSFGKSLTKRGPRYESAATIKNSQRIV